MTTSDFLGDLFSLQDQTVVVIGGAGVLGAALAEGIAQAGARVVISGRNAERGSERAAAIESLGCQASFLEVDATSRDSLEGLCQTVVERHGRVDALVNCFGVNSATPYLDIDDDDWGRVISTNLTSTHVACQTFGRRMIEQPRGGSILNLGSVTSHLPLSRVFAYSASKVGVLSLTKNLAREWAPRNVRVNLLCPGFFPAEQNRKILDEQRVADIMRHTPMGRFGDPKELVGPTLLLLAPKAGGFVTGHALFVDGGFTSMMI